MASYTTLKSGSIRATVSIDGTELKTTHKSREEAEAWALELEVQKLRGDATRHTAARAVGKRRTLATFRTEWLDARRVASGTASTQEGYWRNHIEPMLGRVRLCDLTTHKLDLWVNGMVKRGVGAHTIYGSVMHVSAMLTAAGYRGGDNPRAGMQPLPVRGQALRRSAAVDELDAILKNSDGMWAVLWELMAVTGLRFSEATGLRVSSVLVEPTPHLWINGVNERKRGKDTGGFRPFPKGKKPRAVPLPAFMVPKLAELVAGREPGEYVFTMPGGELLDYDNVYARQWADTLKAAGVKIKIHELRHTYITRLVASGASTQAVQMVGGWADGRMVSTYTDIHAGMLASLASVFEPATEELAAVGAASRPTRRGGKRRG